MAEQAMRHGAVLDDGVKSLNRNWKGLLILGIVWIVLGTIAILMPFAAALAIELVLGAIFAIGGLVQLVQAFGNREWRGFGVQALGALLALFLGAVLLFFPLEGVITLTLFLGAFFIVEGGLKLVAALQFRPAPSWGWVLTSGILGIVVGLLIWIGWPASSTWAIGLLAGVSFIFSGWWMVMLALSARRW